MKVIEEKDIIGEAVKRKDKGLEKLIERICKLWKEANLSVERIMKYIREISWLWSFGVVKTKE